MTGQTREGSSQQDRQSLIDSYDKAAKEWHDISTRYRCTFAEDYCRGAIALVYQLKISTVRRSEHDWPGEERFGLGGKSLALFVLHHQTSDLINLRLRGKEPVLVRNVELVEMVEGFSLPSLVRLYFVKKFIRDPEEGFEFQSVLDKSFQLSPVWIYRKPGPVFVFAGQVGAGDRLSPLPPSIVQSGVEIVQRVSEDESELIRQGCNRSDLDKLVSRFRIILDDDRVRTGIAPEEGSRLSVEIRDVLVGPFNL